MIEKLDLKLSGKLPVNRDELIELVNSWGRVNDYYKDGVKVFDPFKPNECYPLENLNVSKITDLSNVFAASPYNGDLSKWNVSKVKNMGFIFFNSKFNNNSIKNWDVSNVNNMTYVFGYSKFNGNISNWDVSNCNNFDFMFYNSKFDGDISSWYFNKNATYDSIVYCNESFKIKYNDDFRIERSSNEFLKWFEKNKYKIASLNVTKEDEIDIDNYLSKFEDKGLKYDNE